LSETSEALIGCQRDDGFFDTVLKKPGKTYRESSATALIAAGWLHSVRRGYLGEQYLPAATAALEAVEEAFKRENGDTYMTEISAPTIPLHIFPYLGYKFTPRAYNLTYGVAAYIFAAIGYDKILKGKDDGKG
jgi:rhamnogalacturonyl hydrolase YesR